MRAIRLALSGKVVSGLTTGRQISGIRKSDNERIPHQPVAIPRRRDESARESKSSSTPATASTRKALLEPLKPVITPGNVRSTTRANQSEERDTRTGRFTKNSRGSPLFGDESTNSNDKYVDSSSSSADGAVGMAAEKIANAVSSASSGMEETDPAIKAFSEVATHGARL